jgi:mRNA-degrading endonuclease toxin of MazEF toxin-antitoxin module
MTKSIAEQLKGLGITTKGIAQFDVFTIPDELIDFPEDRLGKQRTTHKSRLVIILQNNRDNNDPLIQIVLVAPLSSGQKHQRLDYLLLKKDHSFLRSDSYIRIRHAQPILKKDLKSKFGNVVPEDIRGQVKDRLFLLFEL